MNLGLQLVLGGLRKRPFVPGVEGEGTLVAMPAEFFGNEYVDGTGIVFDGFEFSDAPDGKQAPFSYRVWPQIRVAGTRRFSGLPINPKIHCHIIYELRDGSGELIAYDEVDANLNEWTGELDSPYDDYGNVSMFLNRDAGSYRLIGKAYLSTGGGVNALMASFVYDYTIAKNTGTWFFYDKTNGLSGNDGFDPLGAALTNASYTESTGVISETGKFAGKVLSTEASHLISNRWLSIVVDGVRQRVVLDEIIDDNSARLNSLYKLGSDKTGITSSTGPKNEAAFNTKVAEQVLTSTMLFISGANADIYTTTQKVRFRGFNGSIGVVGYSGKPTLLGTANYPMVEPYSSGSQGSNFEHAILSNVKLDGNELAAAGFGGDMTSNSATDTQTISIDQIEIIRCRGRAAVFIQQSGVSPTNIHIFNPDINNKRTNVEVLAPAGALTAGDGTIQISAPIPANVAQNALIKIVEGGVTEYRRAASWSGDTFVLGYYRQTDSTNLQNSFTSSATITVSDEKAFAFFLSCFGQGSRGAVTMADGDMETYDHHFYPYMIGDNNYFTYNRAKSGSEKIGYHFNMNSDVGALDNLNCSRNVTETDACEYFSDMSTAANTVSQGTMTSMYYHRNIGSPIKGFFYSFTPVEIFFKQNRATSARVLESGMFTVNEGATNELWPNFNWDWVLHDNESVGYRAINTQNSSESPSLYQQGNIEYIGNTSEYYGTSAPVNIGKDNAYANLGVLIFTGNNIYSPNVVGDPFKVDGVSYDLEVFNTLVGGVNTSTPPDINYALTLGQGNQYATITALDNSGTDRIFSSHAFDLTFNVKASSLSFVVLIGSSGIANDRIRIDNATTINFRCGATTVSVPVPGGISLSVDTDYLFRFRRPTQGDNTTYFSVDGGAETSFSFPEEFRWNQIARAGTTTQVAAIVMSNLRIENLTDEWVVQYSLNGGQIPTPPDTTVTIPAETSTGTSDSHSATLYNVTEDNWSPIE